MTKATNDRLPTLLTVKQVVHETQFQKSFIYREIKSGRLEAVKLAGRIRVPRKALGPWLYSLYTKD